MCSLHELSSYRQLDLAGRKGLPADSELSTDFQKGMSFCTSPQETEPQLLNSPLGTRPSSAGQRSQDRVGAVTHAPQPAQLIPHLSYSPSFEERKQLGLPRQRRGNFKSKSR